MNRTIIARALSGLYERSNVVPAPMFAASMIAYRILKAEARRELNK